MLRSFCTTVASTHADLTPGECSGQHVLLRGRILSCRPHGQLAFCDLADEHGQMQLMLRGALAGAAPVAGTIVEARGEAIRTRRGELSVAVEELEVLTAPAAALPVLHGPDAPRRPARHIQLMDPVQRQRMRARAAVVSCLRSRLEADGFIEAETPILQPVYGGAEAHPFTTTSRALDGRQLFLRIAPELYLRRLIIAGFERVYELGRDFRNEGVSARHAPEFTVLELYHAYASAGEGIDQLEQLVRACAQAALDVLGADAGPGPAALLVPWQQIELRDGLRRVCGRDVWELELEQLRECCTGLGASGEGSRGTLLLRLSDELLVTTFTTPTILRGHPADVSPLAALRPDDPTTAERFELYAGGMELADGYEELTNAALTRERLRAQAQGGAYDTEFCDALDLGMPPTCGVGLGVDRLVMLLLGAERIREVLWFSEAGA